MNPNMMMNSMQPQPMMGMNMTNPMYPNPNMMDQNPNMMMGNNITYTTTDMEARLTKLERQVKRLDSRVSRLESMYPATTGYNTMSSYEQSSSGFNSNML